ncbi:2TM domain-containing protein [Myroides phaeus]|uniref:2TM domain-containing protein n=1 Tax=Myroides phaeus TaxID=702745 RepID=UPI002DBDA58C|nr:2TM domain-containing protein [Myroides phaeus]MEC4116776.1 2TM domain-containing protein [Myroides phaeus]
MDNKNPYEAYDYARRRVKQKKLLFFHFAVFFLGSVLMFCFNAFIQDPANTVVWWPYAIGAWSILVFLHAVNVLIVDSFMGKKWEDKQVKRLIEKQEERIKELRARVEKDFPLVDVKRDLDQKNTDVTKTNSEF